MSDLIRKLARLPGTCGNCKRPYAPGDTVVHIGASALLCSEECANAAQARIDKLTQSFVNIRAAIGGELTAEDEERLRPALEGLADHDGTLRAREGANDALVDADGEEVLS